MEEGISMKKIFAVLVVFLVCILLGSCGTCAHEWTQADCINGAVCTKCGEAGEAALGHAWTDASCELPETCSRCGQTQSEALGHDWAAATCELPETCSRCGQTQGDVLEHTFGKWSATKTSRTRSCVSCAATESEEIDEATYMLYQMQGRWDYYMTQDFLGKVLMTVYDYPSGYVMPYLQIEDTHAKMSGAQNVTFEMDIEFASHDAESKRWVYYLHSDRGSLTMMYIEESELIGDYILLSVNGELMTLDDYEEERAFLASTWWAESGNDDIYTIVINKDGTFRANWGEAVTGFWQTSPISEDYTDTKCFYKLIYEKDGEQVVLEDWVWCYLVTNPDETMNYDYGQFQLTFDEEVGNVEFSRIESEETLEKIREGILKSESSIVGSWKPWVDNEESENYRLTVNADGTFTLQLEETIVGTWRFERKSFYNNGDCIFVYRVAGTADEDACLMYRLFYTPHGEFEWVVYNGDTSYIEFGR